MQPSRFNLNQKYDQVAKNLDALDLELSQTQKFQQIQQQQNQGRVLISREDRQTQYKNRVLLESLDINSGYNGIVDMRSKKIEELAKKYKVDMTEF